MTIRSVEARARLLSVTWSDGSTTDFPYQFLLDNDPAGFHPETEERVFDLLSVPEDLEPRSVAVEGDTVRIDWRGSVPTVLSAEWLDRHRPGVRAPDAADIEAVTWGEEFRQQIPRFAAAAVLSQQASMHSWLTATKRYGLSIIENLEDDEEAGMRVGRAVGFLRETNFGVTFRVETKPDPNNLAYTSQALPLHTDLPNQELPPGFQFLHCVRNDATGGGSVFADAFRIAARIRAADAEAFELLSTVPIPYRFHDRETDIRIHRPLVGVDERGCVFDVRYSAHLMDAFDMPAETMLRYYRAYRAFMTQTRQAENIIRFRLSAGQMVVFDNRRVLHGREAFNPATGHRLLKGFYVDRGEVDSRIRQLSR